MSLLFFFSIDITRFDMSPYKTKFVEKICTLFFLKTSFFLKAGSPILIPNFFASLLLAITHPSLFDRTTIGFCSKSGRNTRSHEA